MADSKSIGWESMAPLELSEIACEQVYQAYDLALELSTLLEAINAPDDAPKWSWPLYRMAARVMDAADNSHTACLRVKSRIKDGGIGGVAPDVDL